MMVDLELHVLAQHASELMRLLKRRERLNKRIFELEELLKGVYK